MPEFIDVMVLGAGHSILASNIPTNVTADKFSASFYDATKKDKESLDRYGLFGGSNNYHTYYPDAEPKQFNPSEDEFIEPVFRLLSACIVSKGYMPTEFSEKVLKDSMHLLVGQTVNCDHETDIANAIGSIKEVAWQNSYTIDGIEIPGGINGVLKIDGKANPRIARGINMDPPSIHSNSVTVRFKWKPSHKFDKEWEFYDKLGTIAEDGTMVRRIVTEIVSYMETSLVSHGADPFAQKVIDGKIVNPAYAKAAYGAFKDMSMEEVSKHIYGMDFKVYSKGEEVREGIMKNSLDNIHNTSPHNNGRNSNSNHNNMNEELKSFLEQIFGKDYLSLKENETPSTELALSRIKEIISENQRLSENHTQAETTITSLQSEITELRNKVNLNEKMANIGIAHLSEVRAATVESYKKLMGEEVDENILTLIEAETTNLATLVSLKATYDKQLNEKFPMHCTDCGSYNVSRASSMNEDEDSTSQSSNHDTSIVNTLEDIVRNKVKGTKE